VIVAINLFPSRIGSALVFRQKPRRVVDVVAKDRIAILAILARIENVLVPEVVHLLGWRRKKVIFFLVGQGIKKAPVAVFHPLRFLRTPAQLRHGIRADRAQVKVLNVLFCQQFLEHGYASLPSAAADRIFDQLISTGRLEI